MESESIVQHLVSFGLLGLMSYIFFRIACRLGFMNVQYHPPAPLKGASVAKIFIFFILVQVIIIPSLFVLYYKLLKPDRLLEVKEMLTRGWVSLSNIIAGALTTWIILFDLGKELRNKIWGDSKNWLKHIGVGILCWFMSFPIVMALDQLTAIILILLNQPPVEQVSVTQFKLMMDDPDLFWVTFLTIALIVPITEEILFRGFLQNWIRTKIKSIPLAIGITSVVFAFCHFSFSQGISNIQILLSLFVLSCFLGYVYEREHSLWASIGLHSFFNGLTAIFIIFS